MRKIILFLCSAVLILLCFSQKPGPLKASSLLARYKEADRIYKQADEYNLRSETNEAFEKLADDKQREALNLFLQLVPVAEQEHNDSLAFFIRLKAAVIYHYFDSLSAARAFYHAALGLRNKVNIHDSLFFQPALYTGSILYTESDLDSANWYLKMAEAINDKCGGNLAESQRLYNISGTINFQTGNYRQALNYFEKAISVVSEKNPAEKNLLINYKSNAGITLLKLEEYEKAREIYESLPGGSVYSNEINQNLGFIYLKQNDYHNAISYFRKVSYTNEKKAADLYINMAMAFAGAQKPDSVALYILKAREENLKGYGNRRNISKGLILKFQGDEALSQKQYELAAGFYQQAVIQFSPEFNETGLDKNPAGFSGTFSYINLFNALAAKGDALEHLHHEQNNPSWLQQSLAAYKAAFSLADYVEKTYNSDEARLFLGKIKYEVHGKPIAVSLSLYNITKEKKYLEDAFRFDQQNKASVLALNIHENELKNLPGVSGELLQQEASVKSTITGLSLKMAQAGDSTTMAALAAQIRDHEITLEKIQENLNENADFRQNYFTANVPSVTSLQKILDNKSAILSWHLSETSIVAFIITGNQFDYVQTTADRSFYNAIDSFKSALQDGYSGSRYAGKAVSAWLYKKLVTPLEHKIAGIERLIIIPDDELNYLPFEALQDERENYLLEKFSVSYQYTASLIESDDKIKKADGTLAFAPYTSNRLSSNKGGNFTSLPYSLSEVSDLKGKTLTDSMASKQHFIEEANHYGIIHLATHASANNEAPLQSFINFYPSGNDYALYASEIYNLTLDSTRLIILSACETGSGQLVKGEGLMSLSRAFAYAGCPNIITSLWKAEDKTTAFITKRLHYYLGKKTTKDKALQQAKIDLLKSTEIDPRFKTPNYWSHLVFIGNYEPDHHSTGWWKIALAIILASLVYIFIKKKKPRK